MPWHAQRLMTVNGKLYDIGDELPAEEVESWKHLNAYIRTGWVAGTHDDRLLMAGQPRTESDDPATGGARQTFPREWPPQDAPPTPEPVANAATSPRTAGPPAEVEAVVKGAGRVTAVSEPKPPAAKPAPSKRA